MFRNSFSGWLPTRVELGLNSIIPMAPICLAMISTSLDAADNSEGERTSLAKPGLPGKLQNEFTFQIKFAEIIIPELFIFKSITDKYNRSFNLNLLIRRSD